MSVTEYNLGKYCGITFFRGTRWKMCRDTLRNLLPERNCAVIGKFTRSSAKNKKILNGTEGVRTAFSDE